MRLDVFGLSFRVSVLVQFAKWNGRPAREITRSMRVPQPNCTGTHSPIRFEPSAPGDTRHAPLVVFPVRPPAPRSAIPPKNSSRIRHLSSAHTQLSSITRSLYLLIILGLDKRIMFEASLTEQR